MKILYLSHRIPYPPNKGDKIRSYHQVRHLAENHQVDLACLADNPEDVKYCIELRKICRRVFVQPIHPLRARTKGLLKQLLGGSISVGYFYRKAVQVTVDQWLSDTDYDAIVCFSSTMAEYVFLSCRLDWQARPQLVMDFCDVDSEKWCQYAQKAIFPLSLLYHIESRRIQAYEHKIHDIFDIKILVSQQEAELFARSYGSLNGISVIANGIDRDFFQPAESTASPLPADHGKKPTLVFTGAMDYQANVDAAIWFCREILPKIRRDHPFVQFKIVGSNPVAAVKRLADREGVEVTGFVDDIRPYYAIADVCVVPLRVARGVQNKLLEALAMERAVVTTSMANNGVKAESGVHLLVADSADEFATAVTQLLDNSALREKLRKSARTYVTNNFDWEKNLLQLEKLLAQCKPIGQIPRSNHCCLETTI